ncbi:hypothetical protein BESB_059580 [Besnoitia besnoiti]|uniref:Protein kinase domain-containing protein n=1 Tax=Besnoitia besnoiti TaxID=94643 RepID=A0A2A9MFN9_BESBE|nr:hypothetical protein BESB_059580 [Besnoitia besnoiti]PFH35071.1 hypothetical protein BESB_059580 [Besnoitia besnoiti]
MSFFARLHRHSHRHEEHHAPSDPVGHPGGSATEQHGSGELRRGPASALSSQADKLLKAHSNSGVSSEGGPAVQEGTDASGLPATTVTHSGGGDCGLPKGLGPLSLPHMHPPARSSSHDRESAAEKAHAESEASRTGREAGGSHTMSTRSSEMEAELQGGSKPTPQTPAAHIGTGDETWRCVPPKIDGGGTKLENTSASSDAAVTGRPARRSHSEEGSKSPCRAAGHGWRKGKEQHGHSSAAGELGGTSCGVVSDETGMHGDEQDKKGAGDKADASAGASHHSRWRFGEAHKDHRISLVLHSAVHAMKSLPSTLQREWSMVRKIYRQTGRVGHAHRLARAREGKLHKLVLKHSPNSSKQLRCVMQMKQIIPTPECANALIKHVRRNLENSMREFQHASPALSLRREQLFVPGREFTVRCLQRHPPFTTMSLIGGRLLGGGSEAMVFAAEEVAAREHHDAFIGAQKASVAVPPAEARPRMVALKIFLCEASLIDEPAKAEDEAEAVEWLQMAFWRLAPSCVDVAVSRRLGIATPSWIASVEGMPLVSEGDSHFAILNRVTAMPLMLGDLLAVPPAALNVSQRMYLILRLIQVVANLHGLGVLHNDLKIENLLIGLDGQLYVGDLGTILPNSGQPTRFQRIGTDVYLDPQSAEGFLRENDDFTLVYSPLRDAWATGMICYYIWCGGALPYNLSQVYDGTVSGMEMFKFIANLPRSGLPLFFVCSPEETNPEISEIRHIIESLLALERSSRKTPQDIVHGSFLFSRYRV